MRITAALLLSGCFLSGETIRSGVKGPRAPENLAVRVIGGVARVTWSSNDASISVFSVRKDGVVLAEVEATSFDDTAPDLGVVTPGSLLAVSRTEGVGLQWSAPTLQPGGTHRYSVVAHANARVSEEVFADVTYVPTLSGYRVEREGQVLATVMNESYLDQDAPLGTVTAASGWQVYVESNNMSYAIAFASEDEPTATTPPAPASYRVVALLGADDGPVMTASGARAIGPPAGYWEASVNGGTFTQRYSVNAINAERQPQTGASYVFRRVISAAGVTPVSRESAPTLFDTVDAIAMDDSSVCVAKAAGGVDCFGLRATLPEAFSQGHFVSLSLKENAICGRRADGTAACAYPALPTGIAGATFNQVQTARDYSCGIQGAGRALTCWGTSPPVASIADVRDMSVAEDHLCTLTSTFSIDCRGDNSLGQSTGPGGSYADISTSVGRSCADTGAYFSCFGTGPIAPTFLSFTTFASNANSTCGIVRSGANFSGGDLFCFGAQLFPPVMNKHNYSLLALSDNNACAINNNNIPFCPQMSFVGALPRGRVTTFGTGVDNVCVSDAAGVECFGGNSYNRLNFSNAPVSALELGAQHGCSLDASGNVSCWGTPVSAHLTGQFKRIIAGNDFTCGLDMSDKLRCAGAMPYANTGPTTDSYLAVDAVDNYWCALRTDHTLQCSGSVPASLPSGPLAAMSAGPTGVCGVRMDGSVACVFAPPATLASTPISAVTVGDTHACGLAADGRAYCWGDTAAGRAPPGPSVNRYSTIRARGNRTYGLTLDGELRAWGSNQYGSAPNVLSSEPLTEIYTSLAWGCGLTPLGEPHCWGLTAAYWPPPYLSGLRGVSMGDNSGCGLTADGHAKCWGGNSYGEANVPSNATYLDVITADYVSCVVQASDNKMVCYGQPNTSYPATPTLTRYKKLSRNKPVCGIRADNDAIECFNSPNHDPPPGGAFKSVATNYAWGCAIDANNHIQCWGNAPPITGPTPETFAQVVVGDSHACGLTLDHRVLCYGDNSLGQFPPELPGSTYLAAQETHTCVAGPDHRVACYGLSYDFVAPQHVRTRVHSDF